VRLVDANGVSVANLLSAKSKELVVVVAKLMEENLIPPDETSGAEPMVVVEVSHVTTSAMASAAVWVSAGSVVLPTMKHGDALLSIMGAVQSQHERDSSFEAFELKSFHFQVLGLELSCSNVRRFHVPATVPDTKSAKAATRYFVMISMRERDYQRIGLRGLIWNEQPAAENRIKMRKSEYRCVNQKSLWNQRWEQFI
jgi:hypothetical protein